VYIVLTGQHIGDSSKQSW